MRHGHIGRNTITMVLGGGKVEQLSPLTLRRPTPRVSFGGKYKIIDIVLSNLVISDGSIIGYDPDADRRKGYTASDSGIVVVPRSDK